MKRNIFFHENNFSPMLKVTVRVSLMGGGKVPVTL